MNNVLPVLKALSDETRLRILSLLKEGELCVCDIADTLKMTQPNISFHLGMVKEAGLRKDRKNGQWTHYSIDESDMFRRFLLMGIFDRVQDTRLSPLKKKRKC